ncbi:TP53-target gene 5 protein [Ctenodactylus gundi]
MEAFREVPPVLTLPFYVPQMEDERLQAKTKHPVSRVIERNRLKMVLRNLSLLKLFKSSNRRIQELHHLARRCWNSMLRVPNILRTSSGNNVFNKVKEKNKELQEDKSLETKLESTEEPEETMPKEWQPMGRSGISNKGESSLATAPLKEDQVEPEVPRTSRDHGLNTGAQGRQITTKGPHVVFLKTHHHKTPMGAMKQPDVTDQYIWFEGLPTRIHLPRPRVMCRPSTLRWVRRCCTRFCSASLELPMYKLYKVGATTPLLGPGETQALSRAQI